MTDRPIIFSAPMVRALLAGRKTQTRRLATSPLRRCGVGDRLYVRESHSIRGVYSDVVEVGYMAHQRSSHTEFVEQIPIAVASGAVSTWPKYRPSIHMPRWASRTTLIVEDVRVEPLQAISEADSAAEGARQEPIGVLPGSPLAFEWDHGQDIAPDYVGFNTAHASFRHLWNGLHTKEGERWQDNPYVVALTFRVVHGNIDRVPS